MRKSMIFRTGLLLILFTVETFSQNYSSGTGGAGEQTKPDIKFRLRYSLVERSNLAIPERFLEGETAPLVPQRYLRESTAGFKKTIVTEPAPDSTIEVPKEGSTWSTVDKEVTEWSLNPERREVTQWLAHRGDYRDGAFGDYFWSETRKAGTFEDNGVGGKVGLYAYKYDETAQERENSESPLAESTGSLRIDGQYNPENRDISFSGGGTSSLIYGGTPLRNETVTVDRKTGELQPSYTSGVPYSVGGLWSNYGYQKYGSSSYGLTSISVEDIDTTTPWIDIRHAFRGRSLLSVPYTSADFVAGTLGFLLPVPQVFTADGKAGADLSNEENSPKVDFDSDRDAYSIFAGGDGLHMKTDALTCGYSTMMHDGPIWVGHKYISQDHGRMEISRANYWFESNASEPKAITWVEIFVPDAASPLDRTDLYRSIAVPRTTIRQAVLGKGKALSPILSIRPSQYSENGDYYIATIDFNVEQWDPKINIPTIAKDPDTDKNDPQYFIGAHADNKTTTADFNAEVSIHVGGINGAGMDAIASDWEIGFHQDLLVPSRCELRYLKGVNRTVVNPVPGWDSRVDAPSVPFVSNHDKKAVFSKDSPGRHDYGAPRYQRKQIGTKQTKKGPIAITAIDFTDPLQSVTYEGTFCTWLMATNRSTAERVYLKWVRWHAYMEVTFDFTMDPPWQIQKWDIRKTAEGDGQGELTPSNTPSKMTEEKIKL